MFSQRERFQLSPNSTERSIRKRLARQKELRKKQGVKQTENSLYKKPKKIRAPKTNSYVVLWTNLSWPATRLPYQPRRSRRLRMQENHFWATSP